MDPAHGGKSKSSSPVAAVMRRANIAGLYAWRGR